MQTLQNKNILLIAGSGAIGSYVSKEVADKGGMVDVICLDEKQSTDRVRYTKANATLAYLTAFLDNRHYDAIVNFLHYTTAEAYAPYHTLLTAHTDQLVVLSSYRVYADEQHPLTESAPFLADVTDDTVFLETETYAMGKTRCERYIRQQKDIRNWTIVRPVISFAGSRFDVVMHTKQTVVEAAREGKVLPLPIGAKNLVAGLDWAGNTGKLIAHLLCKPETLGEAYTVTSGQNPTWGTIADWYTALCGVRFTWIDDDAYAQGEPDTYRLMYDRLFNRDVDNRKILAATGLTKDDFRPMQDAIREELDLVGALR